MKSFKLGSCFQSHHVHKSILTLTLGEVLSCNSMKELGCGEKVWRFSHYFSIELALDIKVLFSGDFFHACLLLSLPKRKSLLEELDIQAKLLGSATLE